MNLQKILQTIRLKLQHHPLGQQLLLLVSPFYARPHHFSNSENSVIGSLGLFAPLAPALLFYHFVETFVKILMGVYATKQAITKPMFDAFNSAGNILSLLSIPFSITFIFIGATIPFFYNKILCIFWRNIGHQPKPAPFNFYLTRFSSGALWICISIYAALYIFKFGIDNTMKHFAEFIASYPITTLIILLTCYIFQQIAINNSTSSAMEIYGSRKVVVINGFLSISLLYAVAYFLSLIAKTV